MKGPTTKTYKVQFWLFKWWTTNTYTGYDALTLSKTAWKTMESKAKLLKIFKWQISGG